MLMTGIGASGEIRSTAAVDEAVEHHVAEHQPARRRRSRPAPRAAHRSSCRAPGAARAPCTSMWPIRMCSSWIRAVTAEGTVTSTSHSAAHPAAGAAGKPDGPGIPGAWPRPAPRARSGCCPRSRGRCTTSPGRASPSTWRAKIASNPKSLPQAVSAEVSVVSAIAAIGGPVGLVADDQLGGDVLAVRGAAAIAEQQQLAARAQARLEQLEAGQERRPRSSRDSASKAWACSASSSRSSSAAAGGAISVLSG